MNTNNKFSHVACKHYIRDYYIGFRLVKPRKGEHYDGIKYKYHTLVFLYKGVIEFAYNESQNYRFQAGDLFFIPHSTAMYGTALEDCHILILIFDINLDMLCESCSLSNYLKGVPDLKCRFRALKMPPLLLQYVQLMEKYIKHSVRCAYMHAIKQRELFVLLQYCYTREEVLELFHPILQTNNFRSWVLTNYIPGMHPGELALKCNMQSKSFSHKFKAEFGETPRDWLLKQKAKHIRVRLMNPNVKISDVVKDYKFSDVPHFHRFCKKYFACTPKELLNDVRDEMAVK